MRITTTYFGPAELKNLNMTKSWSNNVHRALLFSQANCSACSQPPKLQCMIDLFAFNYGFKWMLIT